jgi:hypothetical protein
MSNIYTVRVELTTKRVIAKYIKYLMLATMTFCLVYIALWFHHYEQMVL